MTPSLQARAGEAREALIRDLIWEADRIVKQAAKGERDVEGRLYDTVFGLIIDKHYAALIEELAAGLPVLRPIEEAPRVYVPALSIYNHHSPQILGLWGRAFYSVCQWGGPSNPTWIGGDNKPVPFQPTRWMPLPPATEDSGFGAPAPPPKEGGER